MACIGLSPFLFFSFTSAKSVLYSLFSFSGSFSSILLTVFFFQHYVFNTFSPRDVLFTEFGFWNIFKKFYCFACKIKSLFAENHGHFLTEFCCQNSSYPIGSRWFLLFFQPIICNHFETICNLHSCYWRTALISQPIRIDYFFRVYY